MNIKEKIEDLQKKRYEYIREQEESFDPSTGAYKEKNKEIDKLAELIKDYICEHQETLAIEFIIEQLTMLGLAPSIVYDDNGHFAVTGPIYSTVSAEEGPEDIKMYFFVEKYEFEDTIREALRKYLEKINE